MTNPYTSPTTDDQATVEHPLAKYKSRMQAILAESWCGAKFGGKCMGIILSTISVLMWAGLVVFGVYRRAYLGEDRPAIPPLHDLATGLLLTLIMVLLPTMMTAVIIALIRGGYAAIAFRKVVATGVETERASQSTDSQDQLS